MSKITIKEEIFVKSKSEKEVKRLVKELRSKGYTTSNEIYENVWDGTFTIKMYGKWKKFKTQQS